MSAFHVAAESYAHTLAVGALPSDVPIARYVPVAGPAAKLHVLIGPATLGELETSLSGGRSTARMDIQYWISAAGDSPQHVERLSELADLLVTALAADGAQSITTQTRQSSGELMPTYARLVTAVVTLTEDCRGR